MINLKIVHSIKKDLGIGETGFLKQRKWKKENSWQKSFFQIMLYEALKICEKWYLLIKSNIKQQEVKDLVTASHKLL